MSANQIPHVGPKPDDIPGRPREHECPMCWMNGGAGHTVRQLQKLRRNELDYKQETPMAATTRRCSYWSARQRQHCGATHKVQMFAGVGERCVTHDPDTLNDLYRTLFP